MNRRPLSLRALQHRCLAGGAAALAVALVLLAWPPAKDDAIEPGSGDSPAQTGASLVGPWMSPIAIDKRTLAAPAVTQTAPLAMPQGATAGLPIPITVGAPQKLGVGESHDLVVGLRSNPGIGEIGFTVQFDANVLQVRAGAEGDWAAGGGATARFAAAISAAEDRIQVRSSVSGQQRYGAVGSIALVQFQAVAPGTTSVMVSDVTVRDLAGNPMPFLLSSSNLQVTVESVPPPSPGARRPQALVPSESTAIEPVEGTSGHPQEVLDAAE